MRSNTIKASAYFAVWLMNWSIGFCVAASSNPDQIRIDGIRVMPYYTDQGIVRTSTDLLDERLVLRNIVIPPGPMGDPLHRLRIEDWDIVFGTTAIFVDVTIAGADLIHVSARERVSLLATAKTSARTLASQDVQLSALIVGNSQKLHVPFLVYGTGCEPVELKVQVHNSNASGPEVVRTIPFTCGD